ncbi:MAG: hypothetical protein LUF04_06860 [Bacteroides sp.]|nr:hypothetical protein [Bacteroides sp.]
MTVEPSDAITVKTEVEADIQEKLERTNKWLDIVRFDTRVVDPASLLKLTRLWI